MFMVEWEVGERAWTGGELGKRRMEEAAKTAVNLDESGGGGRWRSS